MACNTLLMFAVFVVSVAFLLIPVTPSVTYPHLPIDLLLRYDKSDERLNNRSLLIVNLQIIYSTDYRSTTHSSSLIYFVPYLL